MMKKTLLVLLFVAAFALCGCGASETKPSESAAPTEAATKAAPTTAAPTEAPTTAAPTTEEPATTEPEPQPFVGVWVYKSADGKSYTLELNEDGSALIKKEDGTELPRTWHGKPERFSVLSDTGATPYRYNPETDRVMQDGTGGEVLFREGTDVPEIPVRENFDPYGVWENSDGREVVAIEFIKKDYSAVFTLADGRTVTGKAYVNNGKKGGLEAYLEEDRWEFIYHPEKDSIEDLFHDQEFFRKK